MHASEWRWDKMNRIVVYTSNTGFTRKYAEWIAEELDCEAVELKRADLSAIDSYDQVIYGGWVMGNIVSGYEKIKDAGIKDLIVFCSGISVPTDTVKETIAKQNGIRKDRLFCFEGGYNPAKVGFMGKMMIKMIAGSLRRKKDKTTEDLHMLATVNGADHTDRAAIAPLIEAAKEKMP